MAFLGKSYGEWSKVEEPTVVSVSYEESDDEKVEIVLDDILKIMIIIT